MNHAVQVPKILLILFQRYSYLIPAFIAGLCIPFGFAPFHLPGFAIIGLALLFGLIQNQTRKKTFYTGFVFGLGFFGLGVSWVYVSIHEYGHLHPLLSALITLFFIIYLALFPALVAYLYHRMAKNYGLIFSCLLFSALWCLGELLRATFMGGFPWLLLGYGQIDTPLHYLLPLIGIYGVGFLTCFAATCLTASIQSPPFKRVIWLFAFIAILMSPLSLKNKSWSTVEQTPLSVGIIQANLSMRDKWDETLFWQLVQQYNDKIEKMIGKDSLIVMPESAIPLPASYLNEFLDSINTIAIHAGTSVLLGIPQATTPDETQYYNTMTTLGVAEGSYLKQHLVPFGEFIPQPFQQLIDWLALPTSNLKPGSKDQTLIKVKNQAIATLICYELAYPQLLRKQMPNAKWIVSISDDGWFGHSFAMYQQLQMAQALSAQTARYQVVSNNDGLSSLIDNKGDIISSLPAYTANILEGNIYPASGASPWVTLGDTPSIILILLIIIWSILPSLATFLLPRFEKMPVRT